MADSNQVQVSTTRETTWGTTPSNDFLAMPITSGSMAYGLESVRSQTVRSDAQLSDSKRVGITPTASFDFELTAQTYDDFMRSAIRSDADWSTASNVSGATDIGASSTGSPVENKFTSTSTNFNTKNIAVGQWIYVSGFTNAANNGWFKVLSVSATGIVINSSTLVTEASGDTINIIGQYVFGGSTEHSYSIQQQYQDLSNKYHLMTGARINSFSLSQTPNGIITGSLGFDGKNRAQTSSKAGSGNVTAAASEDVSSEVSGFGSLWINNSVVSYDIMELSLNVAIPNRPAKGLGSLERTRMPQGSPEITGTMSVYLDGTTWSLDTAFEAFTKQMMAFSLDMQNNDRYLFNLPQIVFTSEPATNPGLDGDIMLTFDFAAEPGGTHGTGGDEKTIVISRTQT